jgi:hypothetical protein
VIPADLRALLADCLSLWGVAGRVETDGDGVAVVTADGRCRLHPAPADLRPVRWVVETPERVAAGRGPRPATSIVAALAVVRAAVDPLL